MVRQNVQWEMRLGADGQAYEEAREELTAFNKVASAAFRERFASTERRISQVAACTWSPGGELLGGCFATVEEDWHWLTIDLLWVRETERGSGLGRALVAAVEDDARRLGCRWSKLETLDFQAPHFYTKCGYVVFAREIDYPPGHINLWMRKTL